jgi:hypothetical protein
MINGKVSTRSTRSGPEIDSEGFLHRTHANVVNPLYLDEALNDRQF